MFYSISGTLAYIDDTTAVIESGGIGYEILIPASIQSQFGAMGDNAKLYTKLIVRENEMYLVGFVSIEDRRLYETLITVSGIGPKQGLKIISELSAGQIRNAIVSADTATLCSVKGIGKKTAERIVLELRDKMNKIDISDTTGFDDSNSKKKMEVLMALRVLGYSDSEARKAIATAYLDKDLSDGEVEDIIKVVLSGMAK